MKKLLLLLILLIPFKSFGGYYDESKKIYDLSVSSSIIQESGLQITKTFKDTTPTNGTNYINFNQNSVLELSGFNTSGYKNIFSFYTKFRYIGQGQYRDNCSTSWVTNTYDNPILKAKNNYTNSSLFGLENQETTNRFRMYISNGTSIEQLYTNFKLINGRDYEFYGTTSQKNGGFFEFKLKDLTTLIEYNYTQTLVNNYGDSYLNLSKIYIGGGYDNTNNCTLQRSKIYLYNFKVFGELGGDNLKTNISYGTSCSDYDGCYCNNDIQYYLPLNGYCEQSNEGGLFSLIGGDGIIQKITGFVTNSLGDILTFITNYLTLLPSSSTTLDIYTPIFNEGGEIDSSNTIPFGEVYYSITGFFGLTNLTQINLESLHGKYGYTECIDSWCYSYRPSKIGEGGSMYASSKFPNTLFYQFITSFVFIIELISYFSIILSIFYLIIIFPFVYIFQKFYGILQSLLVQNTYDYSKSKWDNLKDQKNIVSLPFYVALILAIFGGFTFITTFYLTTFMPFFAQVKYITYHSLLFVFHDILFFPQTLDLYATIVLFNTLLFGIITLLVIYSYINKFSKIT